MLNDYPTVLAVICPLFRGNNFLSSSDQLKRHQNTLLLHFLLQRLNDFWEVNLIFQLLDIEQSETLCSYLQCLIDCTAQKKITGSTIRFRNLASSIEITYIPVAIEPRRFGRHKIYQIIVQEVRKQSFGSRSSDS